MRDTIFVAIADDHAMFRQAVANMLAPRIQVIIQAADGAELMEKLAAVKRLPDICIIDIHMKPMNGYETIAAIKHKYPGIKTLALTAFGDEFTVISALRAGAGAYLNKEEEIEGLAYILEQLYEKGFYVDNLDPALAANAMHGDMAAYKDLDQRELELIHLCCSDLSYAEIAEHIHFSERTLESCRKILFKKLGVSTRPGLVAFAMLTSLGTDKMVRLS